MSRTDELLAETVGWLIEQMESGAATGDWKMPWNAAAGFDPTNAKTGHHYTGGNWMSLSIAAMRYGFDNNIWATFNQWKSLDAKVRKGERSLGVIAVPKPKKWTETDKTTGEEVTRQFVSFSYVPVFHCSQVDGWEAPAAQPLDGPEPIEHAEALVAAWVDAGMEITHVGDRAYYTPAADRINVPALDLFHTAENYYATLAHEATHWTAHESRLARKLDNRFGDDAYAAEELVAELGAAIIASHLGIESVTRDDHAQYIAHWVRVLRTDPKHLWTTAGLASAAANHLLGLAETDTEEIKDEAAA